jgi:hypothetical protein
MTFSLFWVRNERQEYYVIFPISWVENREPRNLVTGYKILTSQNNITRRNQNLLARKRRERFYISESIALF